MVDHSGFLIDALTTAAEGMAEHRTGLDVIKDNVKSNNMAGRDYGTFELRCHERGHPPNVWPSET